MELLLDTIVAPITGLQGAAIAVVRLSGPESWRIASQVFSPWPDSVVPRRAIHGLFVHGDDGLALPFEKGHSYTGEETVEFSVHGSPASVEGLIRICLENGARMARPGEFTERAFLHGRMDLTQAEGVRDTVNAQTESQLKLAHRLKSGTLYAKINCIYLGLYEVLAACNAHVDFSEELGELDREAQLVILREIHSTLVHLLETEKIGRAVRDGVRVAILGRPNAGKSSLLNRLCGENRAIVTDIPGTTRDTIEVTSTIGPILVRWVDTAGLRDSEDTIEKIGMERAREAAQSAELVLYVVDSSIGVCPEDEATMAAFPNSILVANKCDLSQNVQQGIPVCAISGEGIDRLGRVVLEQLQVQEALPEVAIHARHVPLLRQALNGVLLAEETLEQDLPFDLAATGLNSAISAIREMMGVEPSADMLSKIFATFCIGK